MRLALAGLSSFDLPQGVQTYGTLVTSAVSLPARESYPKGSVILPNNVIHVGNDAEEAPQREKLLALMQHFPNVADAVRKLATDDTFRVVMSSKNADLFHRLADGTYPSVLRDASGHIAEHTHLVKTGMDLFSAAPNIILSVAMATIAHKLSVIDAKLDHVTQLLIQTNRGELRGKITALASARRRSIPSERRASVFAACHDLVAQLPASIGQLRALIAAMPEAKTGLFEGLLGSGFAKAQKAYREVQDEMQIILHGTRGLLDAYAELDEPDAAREALRGLVAEIQAAGLPDAIRKARLLPAKPGQPPPEAALDQFRGGVALIGSTILADDPAEEVHLSMDFQPRELCLA